jgi:hypothetical protein
MKVPMKRRAQAKSRVQGERELAVFEVDCVGRARALLALGRPRAPAHAGHGSEPAQLGEGLDEKALRTRLDLQKLSQDMQPPLRRQAD